MPTPDWWLAGARPVPGDPARTIVRLAFREHPTVEFVTPRADLEPDYLAEVAALVMTPPPPPPGADGK